MSVRKMLNISFGKSLFEFSRVCWVEKLQYQLTLNWKAASNTRINALDDNISLNPSPLVSIAARDDGFEISWKYYLNFNEAIAVSINQDDT